MCATMEAANTLNDRPVRGVAVTVSCLDDYVRGNIGFMKVDVESHGLGRSTRRAADP